MSKIILNQEKVIIKISEEGTYAHIVGSGMDLHWEPCSEEIARLDYENRNTQFENLRDGGIYFPSEDMVMPFDCGVTEIIDVDLPEYVKTKEYKYIDGAFVINVPVKIERIKKELSNLDIIINRATEDLYIATGTVAYANVQEVINRKNALRAELAALEA